MSRISSIVEKIDNLSYVTEIGEVSSLAEELLQLQYPSAIKSCVSALLSPNS